MPPEPQPQDPLKETSKPAGINPSDVLLPQKEVRKVESDRRVSAGVLLDQEQKAGREGFAKAAGTADVNAESSRVSGAVPAAKAKPVEESVVQPLETYQGAIENVMRGGDVSVVSIAAAEAQRRAQKGREKPQEVSTVSPRERMVTFFKKISMVGAGIALVAIAAAVVAYVVLRPTTVPVVTAPTAPFILVDDTQSVALSPAEPTRDLTGKLVAAKGKISLSLGLIARLIPSVSTTTANGETLTAMDAQTFLTTVAQNIPTNLLRTIEPTYLLGVHVYDSNQPFLILRVDSYQEAFSGMLSWEYYMSGDLAPLFTYVPRQHIPEENIPVIATTTALAGLPSQGQASSTPAELPFVHLNFVDRIVENHDARVLQNNTGDIYLLWTFVDRNTLVITTNAATLREIISRLQNAPVTAVPK